MQPGPDPVHQALAQRSGAVDLVEVGIEVDEVDVGALEGAEDRGDRRPSVVVRARAVPEKKPLQRDG